MSSEFGHKTIMRCPVTSLGGRYKCANFISIGLTAEFETYERLANLPYFLEKVFLFFEV